MNYIMHYVMYYVVRCVPYSLVPALAILNAQEEAVVADVMNLILLQMQLL